MSIAIGMIFHTGQKERIFFLRGCERKCDDVRMNRKMKFNDLDPKSIKISSSIQSMGI